MEWCTKNAYSDDPSDNLGRCVLHSTNIKCTNIVDVSRFVHIFLICEFSDYLNSLAFQAYNLTYFNHPNFNFDTQIDELMKKDNFNQTLSVHQVKDIETMKKLQL